jgi:hypothetical protein
MEMPEYGACPALSETSECKSNACPIDCKQTDWSGWTLCGVTEKASCQKGRFRQLMVRERNGGVPCGDMQDWQDCPANKCAQGTGGCSHVNCHWQLDMGCGENGVAMEDCGHIHVNHHSEEQYGDFHRCRKEGDSCNCVCSFSADTESGAHRETPSGGAESR